VVRGALRGARGEAFPGDVGRLDPGVLERLDGARLRPDLTRILVSANPDLALVFLHGSGLLGAVLPEVTAMVDFQDEHARHKDLWSHTMQVVVQVEPTAVLRWAALLHDVGKVRTRSIDDRGRVHFLGHELVGARMFKRIARRLDFPAGEGGRIRFLIRNHLRAAQYEPDWTDSAVRRLGREMGDAFDELIALSRADITTRYETKRHRHLAKLDELVKRVRELERKDAIPPALPKGLGHAIMERFAVAEGPGLGWIMDRLAGAVERGELPRSAAHEVYLEHLEHHRELLEGGK
jgi:poly(A) polymerase